MICKCCKKEFSDEVMPFHMKRCKPNEIKSKIEEINLEEKTVAEIKQMLDQKKINYNNRATKKELIELLGD